MQTKTALLLGVVFLCAACSRPMTGGEKGAVAGTAIGAAGGAVIGAEAGNAGVGAAVGGVSGAVVGGTLGNAEESDADTRRKIQEEILQRQQKEMERQDREIEDIKRQKYYDESLRRFE